MKSEIRDQKSEIRLMDGHRYLVWMQLWSDEDQIAGRVMLDIEKKIRNKKSEIRNQKSEIRNQKSSLGVIQKLRGQNFWFFTPPPPHTCVDSFYVLNMDKNRLFWPTLLIFPHIVIEWPLIECSYEIRKQISSGKINGEEKIRKAIAI